MKISLNFVGTVFALIVVVPHSYLKSTSISSLVENMSDTVKLIDAYQKHDYIEVLILLIDFKFKLEPPEQYSGEQLRLLIIRYLLVKMHNFYLSFKKQKLDKGDSDKSSTEAYSLEDYAKSIEMAMDILDYSAGQINMQIDNVKHFADIIIKEMDENTTEISESTETSE